jgi:hypothetical protein
MAQTSCPLYDLDPADASDIWRVRVRRCLLYLALLPCPLLFVASLPLSEAVDSNNTSSVLDWNDLWYVEPICTLDRLCMPRTFFLSPRTLCVQNLKQISICFHSGPSFEGGSDSMQVPEEAVDIPVDATSDHLW